MWASTEDSYLSLRMVIKAIPLASLERGKKVGLSINWPDISFFSHGRISVAPRDPEGQ
jgi:hypothetical protein